MEKNNKLLLAAGIGLAVGGILGILFAPDKGSETRNKIKNRGTKITGGIKDGFAKMKGGLGSLKENIIDRVDSIDDKVNEYV
jgi:hypothetical protein